MSWQEAIIHIKYKKFSLPGMFKLNSYFFFYVAPWVHVMLKLDLSYII